MECLDHQNSETWSDEEDDEAEKVNNHKTGPVRSYECVFCKRGFTNAQALGGHMNIHRKDKAKAKPNKLAHPDSIKSGDAYTTSNYLTPISGHHDQLYVPASNPSYPHACRQTDLPSSTSQNWSLHQEPMGVNLSLQIGPSCKEEDGEQLVQRKGEETYDKENEVDLELRLGHDPRSLFY